jgi:hypothetical protein
MLSLAAAPDGPTIRPRLSSGSASTVEGGFAFIVRWVRRSDILTSVDRRQIGLRYRLLLLTEERKQISVDLILVRCWHAMRRALVHLQRGVLHDLRRQQR